MFDSARRSSPPSRPSCRRGGDGRRARAYGKPVGHARRAPPRLPTREVRLRPSPTPPEVRCAPAPAPLPLAAAPPAARGRAKPALQLGDGLDDKLRAGGRARRAPPCRRSRRARQRAAPGPAPRGEREGAARRRCRARPAPRRGNTGAAMPAPPGLRAAAAAAPDAVQMAPFAEEPPRRPAARAETRGRSSGSCCCWRRRASATSSEPRAARGHRRSSACACCRRARRRLPLVLRHGTVTDTRRGRCRSEPRDTGRAAASGYDVRGAASCWASCGARRRSRRCSRATARGSFYQQMRESMRAAGNRPELRQAEIKLAEKRRLVDETDAALAKLTVRASEPGEMVETLAKVGGSSRRAPIVRVKGRVLHGEFDADARTSGDRAQSRLLPRRGRRPRPARLERRRRAAAATPPPTPARPTRRPARASSTARWLEDGGRSKFASRCRPTSAWSPGSRCGSPASASTPCSRSRRRWSATARRPGRSGSPSRAGVAERRDVMVAEAATSAGQRAACGRRRGDRRRARRPAAGRAHRRRALGSA